MTNNSNINGVKPANGVITSINNKLNINRGNALFFIDISPKFPISISDLNQIFLYLGVEFCISAVSLLLLKLQGIK
ncbi:hypothetical protein PL9214640382 [Planktothrix tepida PCC 9214]|uniref:Uncharacterized protein n=1 Tax=Planktothrix tepida PCC 9214 TaxID=671072 RepID=A0A1J1LPM8_9CYAN|nr:hypothetical protein PL9214640382 [Planktothrix tepida PCC 9214]